MSKSIRTILAIAVATLGMIAPTARAAGTLGPLQVWTDGTLDNPTLAEATPEAQDLIAGFISETDATITVTWKVVDIPDATTGGIPELFVYYFEFGIDDPGPNPRALYSLRGRAHTVEGVRGGGSLQGNCTTTGNVVSCTPVPGAVVTVAIDSVANTVSATMRRSDLKGADGNSLAVDGAVITEEVLFRGIGAVMGAGVYSSAMLDEADLDIDYVLGTPR